MEMGETVETPVMLKQGNNAVIKMSETMTAHAGSKHLRIPRAFFCDEVREGLDKSEKAMRMEQIPTRSHRLARSSRRICVVKTMGPQPGLECRSSQLIWGRVSLF